MELPENKGYYYKPENYANLFERFFVCLIDFIVIIAVLLLTLYLTQSFDKELYFKFNFFFIVCFSLIYLTFIKRSKIGTIGYIITNVEIVSIHGRKPSIFNMLTRLSFLSLSAFLFVIDIFWLTSEETKQTLRDKYLGTYVVNKNSKPIGIGPIKIINLSLLGMHFSCKEVVKDKHTTSA